MKLAIIGTGHVGLVTGLCFAEFGHEVICQDIDREKIDGLRGGRLPIHEPGLDDLFASTNETGRVRFTTDLAEAVQESEVLFVCVGTPPMNRGESNLKFVEGVARQIAEMLAPGSYRLVVDKSTVPVKTAERVKMTMTLYAPADAEFGVASNPEFLKEGAAVEDTLRPDRIVVGTSHERDRELLRRIYEPQLARHDCPYIETNVRSAELIKHVANSFLSMKLSFINLVARVCDAAAANVDDIVRGISLDERIGGKFLRPGIGYGGSCFPKDVPAFAVISEELGIDAELLWDIHEINEGQIDWFVAKLKERLWILEGKTFAVWGLAFKQDTDDVRESPAIKLVQRLLEEGAAVRAHDPVAVETAKRALGDPRSGELPKELSFHDSPLACCDAADALIVATEWPMYRTVEPADVKPRLRLPLVFDGKNSLDPSVWRDAGFRFLGVGRPDVR